ncbi:hypothetical protein JHK84_038239 [Glycine max]|uniref:Uncharacterized protein n=1 Tax=Glycine max TaxID=3847 RepID=A0A0R0H6K0_SOYBN|nr:hypothetical protein JHK85_038581 [Glycine max]KAG5131842.1 hypothetical protein JHK84_038239 [Glycine max]
MTERSKVILQFEHNGKPLRCLLFVFVCAEFPLRVCYNKRESDTQTRRLPPPGTPLTGPLPPSQRTASNSSQVLKFCIF